MEFVAYHSNNNLVYYIVVRMGRVIDIYIYTAVLYSQNTDSYMLDRHSTNGVSSPA